MYQPLKGSKPLVTDDKAVLAERYWSSGDDTHCWGMHTGIEGLRGQLRATGGAAITLSPLN
jgi:hypothetical protein